MLSSLLHPFTRLAIAEAARPDTIARINYKDFQESITRKYGIICANWPLDVFCAPSTITSRKELDILIRACENGTTKFRRLESAEFEAWEAEKFEENMKITRAQAAQSDSDPSHQSTSSILPTPSPSPPSGNLVGSANPVTTLPQTPGPGLPTQSFTGVVAFARGVLVTKEPRKERRDKGLKRGPRKKKVPAVSSEGQQVAPNNGGT